MRKGIWGRCLNPFYKIKKGFKVETLNPFLPKIGKNLKKVT